MTLLGDRFYQHPYLDGDIITQYAKRVVNTSSYWTDSSGSWSAVKILGEGDCVRSYSDCSNAWCPAQKFPAGKVASNTYTDAEGVARTYPFTRPDWDSSAVLDERGYSEFIEVEFERPIYITEVEIGEPRGCGSVVNILAKQYRGDGESSLFRQAADTTCDSPDGEQRLGQRMRFWSPNPVCHTPFLSDRVRLELDTRAVNDWNEIDFIKIGGYEQPPSGVLFKNSKDSDQLKLVYRPDPDFKGVDSIRLEATDCPYVNSRRSEPMTMTFDVDMDDIVCGPGTYESSSRCVPCSPGSFNSDFGATACVACDVNTFNEKEGSSQADACVPCREGSGTQGDGASACECFPGYFSSGRSCIICGAGTFKAEFGSDSCTPCGNLVDGSALTKRDYQLTDAPSSSVDDCICTAGRVLVAPKNSTGLYIGQCQECPEGADCASPGNVVESLKIEKGWWRSSSSSVNLVRCTTELACPGTNSTVRDNLDKQCGAGHSGPLCDVCLAGYAKSVSGYCQECDSGASVAGDLFAFAAFILIVAASVAACVVHRKKKAAERRDEGRVSKRLKRARTKFKILASSFQIVSQFESVLSVRFPPAFEQFTRLVSKFVNLDALNLAKVGCVVQTNFYDKLLFSTLAPICISVIILICGRLLMARAKDHARRVRVVDGAFSIFFSLTYLVFAVVSTTIFDTFNCRTFGDDETEYMESDQSVSCATSEHRFYKAYAGAMMLFYPIGIPALYFVLLVKNREKLLEDDRDQNESVHKFAFLWDDYEPQLWWFEVFECARRLSLTGLLVFVFKGQASQVVVAMILSSLSAVAFVHWRPFVKEEDDNLAIVSQGAIFFTLLAGLLKKVGVDEKDKYDDAMFGTLLVLVNCIGIAMVVGSWLVKPVSRLVKKLGEKHMHDAALKGMTEEHDKWEKFEEYAKQLAGSDEFVAGWETLTLKDWGGDKRKVTQWLEETGVVAEWRCAEGDGPRDQVRFTMVFDHGVKELFDHLCTFGVVGTTLANYPVVDYGGNNLDVYLAALMPWPLSSRDFLFNRRASLQDDEAWILSRSIKDDDAGLKRSAQQGRVRGWLNLGLYSLTKVGEGKTRVVHIMDCDLKGLMKIDSINKKAGARRMLGTVEGLKLLGRQTRKGDEEEGRATLAKRGGMLLRAMTTSVAELGGEIMSKHQKRKKEDTRSRPSIIPPPPPGAPPPNNNYLLRPPSREMVAEIGLRRNPMHETEEESEAVEKAIDMRHIHKAASGGFKAKGGGGKTGPGRFNKRDGDSAN